MVLIQDLIFMYGVDVDRRNEDFLCFVLLPSVHQFLCETLFLFSTGNSGLVLIVLVAESIPSNTTIDKMPRLRSKLTLRRK